MSVLRTGDQNILWDAGLKARCLADMGHIVVHDVHTADVFSRPPQGACAVTVAPEAYLPDGRLSQWTASVESALFLGRMALPPNELTNRGVNLKRMATGIGLSVEKAVMQITEGEWFGVSLPQSDLVAHGVKIEQFKGAYAIFRKTIRDNFGQALLIKQTPPLFDALFDFAANPSFRLGVVAPRILREYLEKCGVTESRVQVTTSLEAYGECEDEKGILARFLSQYTYLRNVYNEAISQGQEAIAVLKEGDLPFYAVVRKYATNELVRVPLEYQSGDTVHRLRTRIALQGEVVAILGKAIPIILTILRSGPCVIPEKGSPYIPQALAFAKSVGGEFKALHEMHTLQVNALDALADVDGRVVLPEYLQRVWGTGPVTVREIGMHWREMSEQAQRRAEQLSGQLEDVIPVLIDEGYVGSDIAAQARSVLARVADYNSKMGEVFRTLPKDQQQSRKDELDREYQPKVLLRVAEVFSGQFERIRAEALRDMIGIFRSLAYWNCRPFATWVDALPGWYEAIRARATLTT